VGGRDTRLAADKENRDTLTLRPSSPRLPRCLVDHVVDDRTPDCTLAPEEVNRDAGHDEQATHPRRGGCEIREIGDQEGRNGDVDQRRDRVARRL
jgi:hypothetical protein